MQKSNWQTGINYRTQRLASCQELQKNNGGLVMAAIFPHWCGSTAGVTTSLDTAGTAMLSEEESYGDSVTFWYNIHKKTPKLDRKSYCMKLMQDQPTTAFLFLLEATKGDQNWTSGCRAQAEADKVTDPADLELQSRSWDANQKASVSDSANRGLVPKETHRKPQKGGKQGCTQPANPTNALLSVNSYLV